MSNANSSHEVRISPAYCVLFESAMSPSDEFQPIVSLPYRDVRGTQEHGFHDDLKPALKAIWYCLHLPRTYLDVRPQYAEGLELMRAFEAHQRILIAPFPGALRSPLFDIIKVNAPCLIFAPDHLLKGVSQLSAQLEVPLGVMGYSQLNQGTLGEHWQAISKLGPGSDDDLARAIAPKLVEDLNVGAIQLPSEFLARAFGLSHTEDKELLHEALDLQLNLAAALEMQKRGMTPDAIEDIKEEILPHFRVPVVLSASGIPERYHKRAFGRRAVRANRNNKNGESNSLTWSALDRLETDHQTEQAVFSILTTHTALGKSGIGLQLGPIENDLYRRLAQLEFHCKERSPNARVVWRLLKDLGNRIGRLFDNDAKLVLRRASSIVIHSNFPLGLAILPGDSSPIQCVVPVSYRPVVPLTRALQLECFGKPNLDFGSHFKVLIAECLADNDPIKPLAAAGWEVIRRATANVTNITIELKHISSIQDLDTTLQDQRYDAIVLSAHGRYNPDRNHAGIVIGNQLLLGPELSMGRVPPLVILSACHVAPRGVGVVTVADMLLRQGAIAVLGTLVPVDVRRNATLMARLFTYIALAISGDEPEGNIGEIWSRVAGGNAINEVLHTVGGLKEFIRGDGSHEGSVIYEFMQKRSVGRLRARHIYQDTEQVLEEIASDRGVLSKFRATLASQSYMPESLFYVFTGTPERIWLRPPPILRETEL